MSMGRQWEGDVRSAVTSSSQWMAPEVQQMAVLSSLLILVSGPVIPLDHKSLLQREIQR